MSADSRMTPVIPTRQPCTPPPPAAACEAGLAIQGTPDVPFSLCPAVPPAFPLSVLTPPPPLSRQIWKEN